MSYVKWEKERDEYERTNKRKKIKKRNETYLLVAPTPDIFLFFTIPIAVVISLFLHTRFHSLVPHALHYPPTLLPLELLRLGGGEEESVFGVGGEVGETCW